MKAPMLFLALALALCGLAPSLTVLAAVDATETRRLLEVYQGTDKLEQRKSAERLTYWAVEDPAIYARVNTLILDNYQVNSRDGDQVDYLAWLLKGLAASGDEQYRGTLQKVAREADHGKLRKYATLAENSLATHTRWNALINQPLPAEVSLDDFRQRNYYNMVIAADLELVRIGAKRISYEAIRQPALAEALNQRILALHLRSSDALSVDTVAWLLKALATCGGAQYRQTFEQVAQGDGHRKIRKHAAKYAANL